MPLDQELKTYLFTYQHDGADWVLEVKASSEQDALARRAKLAYARLDGELVAKIPASAGPIAKAITSFRNALQVLVRPG